MSDRSEMLQKALDYFFGGNQNDYSYIATIARSLDIAEKEQLVENIIATSVGCEEEVRCDIADLVAFIDEDLGIDHCVKILKSDTSELVRRKACWVIENISDKSSFEAIYTAILTLRTAILKDESPGVRIDAIDTLSSLGSVESLWIIECALRFDHGRADDISVKEVAQMAINHLQSLKVEF